MRVWIDNFDFENQLAAGPAYQRTKQLARINSELSAHLIPLAASGDAIATSCVWPPSFLDQLADEGFPQVACIAPHEVASLDGSVLSPWGWSASVLNDFDQPYDNTSKPSKFKARVQDGATFPNLDAVSEINSRAFSSKFETEHAPLPSACEIRSLDELSAAVQRVFDFQSHTDNESNLESSNESRPRFRWVVKANYSMTGRECVRGRSKEIDQTIEGWVLRRLRNKHRLFFEPWLDRVDEFSFHWDIPAQETEPPVLIGATRLVCDSMGRFQGNQVISLDEIAACLEMKLVAVLGRAAQIVEHIQVANYHGPVGVDCMVYRGMSGLELRFAQDINARWSMGRVAIEAAATIRDAASIGTRAASLMHYPTTWIESMAGVDSIELTESFRKHWPRPIRKAIRTTPIGGAEPKPFLVSVLVIE